MIKCLCIDDTNLPPIPDYRKVKKEETYHITHIYKMVNQRNIIGCDLYEKPMGEDCKPYEHWRLSRFAISADDIERILQLAKDCAGLNDLDIEEIKELAREGELMES